MEERAKKAREIVKKIEKLTDDAERIVTQGRIGLYDQNGIQWVTIDHRMHSRLFHSITNSMVGLIADEIATLEAELAEL
ncbi:MAG: hypothetical protein J7559_02920 [Cohnella sp.]|nr:hypothetical protein [Cohnella sp.]